MVRKTIKMEKKNNDNENNSQKFIDDEYEHKKPITHTCIHIYVIFIMLKFLRKMTKLVFCKSRCEPSNVKQYFLNCQSFSSSAESATQEKI